MSGRAVTRRSPRDSYGIEMVCRSVSKVFGRFNAGDGFRCPLPLVRMHREQVH